MLSGMEMDWLRGGIEDCGRHRSALLPTEGRVHRHLPATLQFTQIVNFLKFDFHTYVHPRYSLPQVVAQQPSCSSLPGPSGGKHGNKGAAPNCQAAFATPPPSRLESGAAASSRRSLFTPPPAQEPKNRQPLSAIQPNCLRQILGGGQGSGTAAATVSGDRGRSSCGGSGDKLVQSQLLEVVKSMRSRLVGGRTSSQAPGRALQPPFVVSVAETDDGELGGMSLDDLLAVPSPS